LAKLAIVMRVRVNVGDAKANLSALLARAEQGEDIEIARDGVPVARLTRLERPPRPGQRFAGLKGTLAGQVFLSEDFEFSDHEIDEMLADDPHDP
jgi:prevent-host-death family protein